MKIFRLLVLTNLLSGSCLTMDEGSPVTTPSSAHVLLRWEPGNTAMVMQKNNEPPKHLDRKGLNPQQFRLSPDQEHFLLIGRDCLTGLRAFLLYATETGTCLFAQPYEAVEVNFSHDGSEVLVINYNTILGAWQTDHYSAESGNFISATPSTGPENWDSVVLFFLKNTENPTFYDIGMIKPGETTFKRITVREKLLPTTFELSPDQKHFLISGQSSASLPAFLLYSTETDTCLFDKPHHGSVVHFNSDGSEILATTHWNGWHIDRYSAETGDLISTNPFRVKKGSCR